MKAAYMLDEAIHAVADPAPHPGEVLVRTCASELHVLHHTELLTRWSADYGGPFSMDRSAQGPRRETCRTSQRVTAPLR